MKITITENAAKELQQRIGNRQGYLKIYYDTDGCGCGPGFFTLLFVKETDPLDLIFASNVLPVLIEKAHLIYLDDELKIHYSPSSNHFQLSSPQETFNGAMPFIFQ